MKLSDLINEHSANAVIIADRGSGSAYGERGQCIRVDTNDEFMSRYGDTEMSPLDAPHRSGDGYECRYASEWITAGDWPSYEFRIYF